MHIDKALLRASWQSWIGGSLQRVGPYWMQWLWTGLFSAAIAVGFTIFGFVSYASDNEGAWRNLPGWAYWYGKNLTVSLTIGASIHLAFDALRPLVGGPAALRRWAPWRRTLFFAGVPLACVAVAWPVGIWLAGMPVQLQLMEQGKTSGNVIAGAVLLSLLLTFVFHQFFAIKARQHEAERRAAEAQLRLLQGQIEPHFLFNTLANVQSLMDHDLPRAKQMLDSFTSYLRASLGSLRNEESAVADELDLARNYLQLLQGRMEDRLRFSISADDGAKRQPLPPLLLQPLVENAVVHGLEPSIQGGTVRVTAHVSGAELVLEVHDDGRGMDAPARPGARQGHGMALANIRQRLLARYGSAARLDVEQAHPGTLARITLPLQATTP
jgi:two-component sensor histidine kinase